MQQKTEPVVYQEHNVKLHQRTCTYNWFVKSREIKKQ